MLPWTNDIFFGTSTSGQRVAVIDRDDVCSRGASGCSGRGIHKLGIAPKRASTPGGAGGVGRQASGIGQVRTASSIGGNSHNAIGNGCMSDEHRQLTRSRRARASAQRRRAEIFRRGHAIVLVAMSFSRFPMNIRASIFAAWRAAWRYGACSTERHAIGSDGGTGGKNE